MYPAEKPTNPVEPVDPLTWDDVYPIARYLHEKYPETELANVSFNMIYQWTLENPAFTDDPSLWNESILAAIYQEWFEEVNPI
jgi:FeS assembly protein IscX